MSVNPTGPTTRVALISPGDVVGPLDTDAQTEFLARRVQLLTKVALAASTFFFLAGAAHRAIFLAGAGTRHGLLHPATLAHGVLLVLQGGVYLLAARREPDARFFRSLDVALVAGTLVSHAVQASFMADARGYRVDLLMLLAAFGILMVRAVIVPSTPRITFLLGIVAVIPSLAFAAWDGARRGAMLETVSFATIWSTAAVGLTTFTSKIIYGLQRSVRLAQRLGQYVIERKLGEGGMGEVYLARHTMLRRPTALKLLPAEKAGATTIARFEREVRETSRLTHPNTVGIYDYGRTADGLFYYAMEYLDGVDLQRLVDREGAQPPARVVHVLAQIASALAEAHDVGLVHRDMKPANVVLCTRGGQPDTVKVVDFGLVKDLLSAPHATTATGMHAIIGTPHYLSPEAIRTPEAIDARSDLYAVGAIGYFLLTGQVPFHALTVTGVCAAHLIETPVRPSVRCATPVPPALEAIILQCLEKDPAARPQSASALRDALLACEVDKWSTTDAARAWRAA